MTPKTKEIYAFPSDVNLGEDSWTATGGMQLRDYFAAKAMQGLLSNPKMQPQILKAGGCTSGWIETSAYDFADAMMKARTI
jgi:hypothetical protein